MNDANKKRYTKNHPYNQQPERTKMIMSASADTFGFDCICLIKGLLWGWSGDVNAQYGGAKYASNNVPDVGTDEILNYCIGVSSNFNRIERGELVQMKGHVGIYIGNGEVVECTPAWKNGTQITKLSQRKWLKHGKLKWIEYPKEEKQEDRPATMLSVGDKFKTLKDYKGYTTAADAIEGKTTVSVTYKKGEYYVYKIYVDKAGKISYNISKSKNVPGAWVVL